MILGLLHFAYVFICAQDKYNKLTYLFAETINLFAIGSGLIKTSSRQESLKKKKIKFSAL